MENDPLAELRDLHLPEAVSWWPLAPGWWLLLLIGLIALAMLARKIIKLHQQNRYRSVAQEELDHLLKEYQQNKNKKRFLVDTHKLLRRVALHHYSEQQQDFAGLTGSRWQDFLNNCCQNTVFGKTFNTHFTALPYQHDSDFDQQHWHRAISNWLEQHN